MTSERVPRSRPVCLRSPPLMPPDRKEPKNRFPRPCKAWKCQWTQPRMLKSRPVLLKLEQSETKVSKVSRHFLAPVWTLNFFISTLNIKIKIEKLDPTMPRRASLVDNSCESHPSRIYGSHSTLMFKLLTFMRLRAFTHPLKSTALFFSHQKVKLSLRTSPINCCSLLHVSKDQSRRASCFCSQMAARHATRFITCSMHKRLGLNCVPGDWKYKLACKFTVFNFFAS